MSLTVTRGVESTGRFPRVSGDEPFEGNVGHLTLPFSPRERG